VVLHEDGHQQAELLVHYVLLSLFAEEAAKLALSHGDFFSSPDKNYVSKVVRKEQEGVAKVFPDTLILLDPHLARVNDRLDLFHVVHQEVAVDLLDQDALHLYRLKTLHQNLAYSGHILLPPKDPQVSEVIHLEDVIYKKLFVVVEVYLVARIGLELN